MNEVLSIGPFVLKWGVLAFIISAAVLWLVMLWVLYRQQEPWRIWSELLLGNIVTIALCYKFGFLWDDPALLWTQPKTLILTSGGSTGGWILGAILILGYTQRFMRRKQLSWAVLFNALSIGLSSFAMVLLCLIIGLDKDASLWPYALVAILLTAWLLLFVHSSLRTGNHMAHLLIGSGIGGMIVTISAQDIMFSTIMFGLSVEQWIFTVMALTGVYAQHVRSSKRDSSQIGGTY